MENEFPLFAKRNVFEKGGQLILQKVGKSILLPLDMAGERKDRSKNYDKVVILKSTREREREREREKERIT